MVAFSVAGCYYRAVLPYVEAFTPVKTVDLSPLVGDFARVHMFLSLFDGDPDKWIEFIEREGTSHEREHDLPFARAIKYRMAHDPTVIPRLRKVVQEFSSLVRLAS
jgi:hypothetical protein